MHVVELKSTGKNDETYINQSQNIKFICFVYMKVAIGKSFVAKPYSFVKQIKRENCCKCNKYIQIRNCAWVDKNFAIACTSSVFQESFRHLQLLCIQKCKSNSLQLNSSFYCRKWPVKVNQIKINRQMKKCFIQNMLYKDKIQMSSQKIRSFLKKTQPTLKSSYRQTSSCRQATTKSKYDSLMKTDCPQISEFKINQLYSRSKSREKVYVHNLHIDYGRLQKPNHSLNQTDSQVKYVKIKEIKTQQFSKEQYMQTKRLRGISSFAQKNSLNQKDKQNKGQGGIKISMNLQKTEQKTNSNLQGYIPICLSLSKSKIRLQEVRAYNQTPNIQNSKKKLHSRIVNMIVAGGNKKTKIITYPDKKDYEKLYSHK